ncbi:MAG: grasp-with-spasm system SPASM domain peptide maturase [Bacteroidales bacterium]
MNHKIMEKYFKMFSCCIPVKGVSRSVICDLQRNSFEFIPNDLYNIIHLFPEMSISSIKEKYNKKFDETIDEYIEFLVKNEFGFYCTKDELVFFPELDLEWDYPARITNAIIDLNKSSDYCLLNVFQQLEMLNCKDIQIRIFDVLDYNQIEKIISYSDGSIIKSIELLICYNENITNNELFALSKKYTRIKTIVIHGSYKDDIVTDPQRKLFIPIQYRIQKIVSEQDCGRVSVKDFSINNEMFTESLKFNTCLNRKISINTEGEIKNCPSLKKTFGNIKSVKLEDVCKMDEFRKLWEINKDKIKVCKDCEFRYICTDCRAYIKDKDDIYSKPLKCGYDPYNTTFIKN